MDTAYSTNRASFLATVIRWSQRRPHTSGATLATIPALLAAGRNRLGSGDAPWLKYSAVVSLPVFHHEAGLLEALRAVNELLTSCLRVILGQGELRAEALISASWA